MTTVDDVSGNTASWSEWISAYARAYDILPESAADAGCPNCGARTLGLAFTGLVQDRVGYASFWCSTCLFGIHLSRVVVPDGVPMESIDTPPGERTRQIPNYRIVPEEADNSGEDVESFQF